MSHTSRVPGDFAHYSVGTARRVNLGWQQFMMTDDQCVIEDPLNQVVGDDGLRAASPSGDGSIVETTGATVVTFADGHDGGSTVAIDGCVAFKPLRDAFGEEVNYGTPFTLRMVLELVSISGGYSGTASNKNQPMIVCGIAQQFSDFDAGGASFMAIGYRLNCTGSEDIAVDADAIVVSRVASGAGQRTEDHTTGHDNHPIISMKFTCGPDLDADGNCHGSFVALQPVGGSDPFDAHRSGAPWDGDAFDNLSLNANQGTFTAPNSVKIFVAVTDKTASDGSETPAVVTFKVHYLVSAAPAWGGSGAV
jgi:hypothetical protein